MRSQGARMSGRERQHVGGERAQVCRRRGGRRDDRASVRAVARVQSFRAAVEQGGTPASARGGRRRQGEGRSLVCWTPLHAHRPSCPCEMRCRMLEPEQGRRTGASATLLPPSGSAVLPAC